jgi:hypothetical protein
MPMLAFIPPTYTKQPDLAQSATSMASQTEPLPNASSIWIEIAPKLSNESAC